MVNVLVKMEHYKSRNNDYYHFTNPHDDRSQFDDDSDEFQYYYDVDHDFNFHNSSSSANSKTSDVSVTVEEIGGFDSDTFIFQLENSMKIVTDKLRHEVAGVETRISRLEDETCKLDKYVVDVKDSEERYHGSTNTKLNRMQTTLQEVQDGVLFLKDKHEIAETQLQLAKLQVLKRGSKTAVRTNRPQSSSHIPFTEPLNQLPSNGITFSQHISYRQAPEVIAQQHVIPSNQQTSHQYNPDPRFPHFTQTYQLNLSQETPNKPSYSYASSVQNLPSEPARWDFTQEHELTRSSRNYKSELYAKNMPEFDNFPNCHPRRKPPSLYENSDYKPVEYPRHPQEENRSKYMQIPVSQTLPHALPTAIDLEDGSRSEEIGNSLPVDDIVNKVTSMGFRRDLVKSCVRKLTVNGSVVDLNAVLDTMMSNNMK